MVAVVTDLYRPSAGPTLDLRRAASLSDRRTRTDLRQGRRQPAAVYLRRRLVGAGLLLVLTALSFLVIDNALNRTGGTGGGPLAAIGPTGAVPVGEHVWVVEPGDTLWSIATKVDPGSDPRPLVDRLSTEIHGAALYAGERIAVP